MPKRKKSSAPSSLAAPDEPMNPLSIEDRVSYKFGESRRLQGRLIQRFLAIVDPHDSRPKDFDPLPVVQLSGPRGAGKTSVLREVLVSQPNCVFLDCKSMASASAVMTCILRKLATDRVDQTVPDKKPQEKKKLKSLLMTPKVLVSEDDEEFEEERWVRRGAFKDAQKKLGATKEVKKATKENDRLLEIAQWSEVRSITSFKLKLEALLQEKLQQVSSRSIPQVQSQATTTSYYNATDSLSTTSARSVNTKDTMNVYIILDDVHWFLTPTNPTATSHQQSPYFKILDFLFGLREQLILPVVNRTVNFCIVLLSNRILPPWITQRVTGVIPFPAYSLLQMRELLESDLRSTSIGATYPHLVKLYVQYFTTLNYPYLKDDFSVLSKETARVFTLVSPYMQNEQSFAIKMKQICESQSTMLKGVQDGSITPATTAPNSSNNTPTTSSVNPSSRITEVSDVKAMSRLARLLIVGAFLAAHNPKEHDAKIFLTHRSKQTKKSIKAFKEAKINAHAISVRPPSPFNLPRYIAITEYLNSGYLEQSVDVMVTIRSLTQQGYLMKCGSGNSDWLDGNLKLTCHAPLDLVASVADSLNIQLSEVLFGA